MNRLTIIDGNSLLFRAYYATAFPGADIMRSQDGTPTNAVFAFSNMLTKIIASLKEGEAIFVAFDAGKHNFRHDALETYKANRKPAPEDLVKQFPLVREYLKALNVFQFEEIGFEGDDIAGSVAKKAKEEGYEVHLYTSDRDFLQLADEKISIHILKKGLSDVMIMTPTTIQEQYGIEPKQIVDYKGLRGDSSDNLPGIPGIGEKNAIKLIQKYGSFDEIIKNATSIKGKIGEAIFEHQELGQISRDLAIIKTDIALPFSIASLVYKGYDFQTLNSFCQKYGFKQLMNKIPNKWKQSVQEIIEINEEIVTTLSGIDDITSIGIALDFDNLDYTNSDVYGIAFEINSQHLYISLEDAKKDNRTLEILASNSIQKYCYDFKAIKVSLSKHGITLNGLFFDLLIASYLIDSSLKNNPDSVMNLFGIDLDEKEETISLFTSQNPKKAAKIAYFSKFLYEKANVELGKIGAISLYNELELPLCIALADMEIEGFPLDLNVLHDFGHLYEEKIKQLEQEIYDMVGERFNIASPKQLGDILFNKLKLKSNRKMSTSVEYLKDLINEHPIIQKILDYRKYFKLITTYIEGLEKHIYNDGKIHAKFNQVLTTTGRLSSSDPNMQNISIRDEESKMIRKAFYYHNEDYLILSLDYSQIELRVLASLSNCDSLKKIIVSGEDIHSATAKKIFNLTSEPTELQRRRAKTVNFGIVYGISDWGLAEQLDISPKEAKDIINSFYMTFPEISVFFQEVISKAMKDGYVSTLRGRRRYLRELSDGNYQTREFAKRAAMNAPIQGTAADLIKEAMIKVNKALNTNNLETKMVLQIHDELIFKVPLKEKDIALPLIKQVMENAISLDVPLEVDGGFGLTWYDAK